jgi:ubiquinone/menaquinone biosynthesis C-methylase UbiE
LDFSNVYEDSRRAGAYSRLEFPGTYYLAYRDLPAIIAEHVKGNEALDFGCGSGRSTRFLTRLGFQTTGIDISEEMVRRAMEIDPQGSFQIIREGDFSRLPKTQFDLILCAFPFDNIPTMEKKVINLRGLRGLLKAGGVIINLVSSPEIYLHEWASFSTKDFQENRHAKSGDIVRIIQMDIDDKRPVEDILWTDDAYLETYRQAGLKIVQVYRPLAKRDEQFAWVTETTIPPWVIYILCS